MRYTHCSLMVEMIKSIGWFCLAGVCELGGAYLIWLWLREGRSAVLAVMGAAVLAFYGFVHTLQPAAANYGRVQAAYSGFFIAMALLWGWQIDKVVPDRYDLIGAGIAMVGVFVIMYWPRA